MNDPLRMVAKERIISTRAALLDLECGHRKWVHGQGAIPKRCHCQDCGRLLRKGLLEKIDA